MKRIAALQVTGAAARYGEHAPMATACCNACRTCVTSNLLGLAMAAAGGAIVPFRRALGRRANQQPR